MAKKTNKPKECTNCYGKGYSTVMYGERGADDFGGEGYEVPSSVHISFCSCDRGQQLKRHFFTRAQFKAANDLLRSAFAVAERNGKETNWETFRNALKRELDREHKLMYPEFYPHL